MHVQRIAESQRKQWNTFAAGEPSFALLQSWEWGQFKQRLGWIPFRIGVVNEGKIIAGAQVLIKRFILGLATVAYIPRGPIGSWGDPQVCHLLFSEIHRVARHHRAVFIKIEPPVSDSGAEALLRREAFKPTEHTNQPRATLTIDLTQILDTILARMRPKTRQYIRRAPQEGIVVRIGGKEDLPAYYALMRLTAARDSFPVRSRAYYEAEYEALFGNGRGALLMAYREGELLAVRTVYRFGKHAAEFHAGSIHASHLHPNYLLVWEAIKWARARGCQTYDMWGIPDELATSRPAATAAHRKGDLWGVYQFKSGFGGAMVSYIGAYDYSYIPSLYMLFNCGLFKKSLVDRMVAWMDLKSGIRRKSSEHFTSNFPT